MIDRPLDDFDREVYCLGGLPFDAVTMPEAVARVRRAVTRREPCFLSTPNLNFLIACLGDASFRDSVIHSDLNVADGMPLVWMARLLGLPIKERVAGSGLFEQLRRDQTQRMSVYFFGGPEGVAERASHVLNAADGAMRCVGFECPGFGSIEQMSSAPTLASINASGADFLVVALGARKGQAWIEHNRSRLDAPVMSHLGAVVNFVAGTVSRAPVWMQKAGLEWMWRIKEEPALWRRYWQDGVALLGLLFTRVMPYAFWRRAALRRVGLPVPDVRLTRSGEGSVHIEVAGAMHENPSAEVRAVFREAALAQVPVMVNLAQAESVSPGFIGLILMLRKRLDARGVECRVQGASTMVRRLFYWNAADYLLTDATQAR